MLGSKSGNANKGIAEVTRRQNVQAHLFQIEIALI